MSGGIEDDTGLTTDRLGITVLRMIRISSTTMGMTSLKDSGTCVYLLMILTRHASILISMV